MVKTRIVEFFRRVFGLGREERFEADFEEVPEGECFLRISYATDKGHIRETNEDSFFIDGRCRHIFGKAERDCYIELTGGTHIFGIFDGMGGEAHGEAASALSAVALERAYEELRSAQPMRFGELINEFCRSANAAILDMLKDRSAQTGGSTFAAVCIRDGTAYPFALGDSRVYLYTKSGGLTMLTRDHTAAYEKLERGLFTEKQARRSFERHALTHFLGEDRADKGLNADAREAVPLGNGSVLVMCTDGLSDMLTDKEIAAVLAASPPEPAAELVELALKKGGRDNVTCIVIEDLQDLQNYLQKKPLP